MTCRLAITIIAPLLLMATGCSSDNSRGDSPFSKIRPGWSKDRVVELVGEPSRVLLPPFEGRQKDDCTKDAQAELTFERGKSYKYFVYLDKDDDVLCVIYGFYFLDS